MNEQISRGKLAKKNIILSFFNKGIAILISFLFVSATIDYLDPVNYGIWITLSSVVTWAGYFDFGIQHGFRNHLTKALANSDHKLAKNLVSTSYILLTFIYLVVFLIFFIINCFIDWKTFLNIEVSNHILRTTFSILVGLFSVQAVLKLIQTVLTSDQRNAYAAMLYTAGQACALIGVYILTATSSGKNGSLIDLAWLLGGIPIITYIIFSILLFSTRYKEIRPSISWFTKKVIRNIIGLGSKFFFIQLSLLVIFQCTSIIITKNLGPESATIYNISYKYMSVVYLASALILTPFWSAFTDAYEKKDYQWMIKINKKLKRIWYLTIPALTILVLLANFVYKIWIKDKVEIPLIIDIEMAIYMLCMTRGAINMFLINGIGKVTLQMIVYVFFAIISIPIMYYSSKIFGLQSIILFSAFVYLAQAVIGEIQLNKILQNKATGIWNK